jgi:ABC-2 type transport system ATP-binding protein
MLLAPAVLFLDEPTAGLDPRGRNEVWRAVRSLVGGGTTVLLTTQYLDEADQLADRIAVMDAGRVIADDTPSALKNTIGGERIEVIVADAGDLAAAVKAVARVASAAPETDQESRRVHAPVSDRVAALTDVARTLQDQGVGVADLGLRRPTLDDVFLQLTGHHAEKEEDAT